MLKFHIFALVGLKLWWRPWLFSISHWGCKQIVRKQTKMKRILLNFLAKKKVSEVYWKYFLYWKYWQTNGSNSWSHWTRTATFELATDFVLNVPKCKKKFAVPEWNRLWLARNQALWAWIWEFEMYVHQICEFDPFWMDLIQKNPKIKWPFLFFSKIWHLFILLRSMFFAERHSDGSCTNGAAQIVV